LDQELRLRNEYHLAENRALKAQLRGRLRLGDADRARLGEIGHRLGRKALSEMAIVARPDTILTWHRRLVARKLDRSRGPRTPGRPRIDREVEALIIRMAEGNRCWGYDRIVGALTNLGHKVSDQTIGNVLRRHGIPPAPERKRTITWAEFIRIHLAVLVGTGISTARLLIGKLVTYCMPFFIYLDIRSIRIARIVSCPNKPPMQQMARSAIIRRRRDVHKNLVNNCTSECAKTCLDNIAKYHLKTLAFSGSNPYESVDAKSSTGLQKTEPSKVIPFDQRSPHRTTNSHTVRRHCGKSTLLLSRQITETRCQEAGRCRERLGELQSYHHQKAA